MKKWLLTAISGVFLTACGSSSKSGNDLKYIAYQDLNGKTQQVAFLKTLSTENNADPKTSISGEALQKANFGNLDTHQKIGDIYTIYDAQANPMNVIFVIPSRGKSFSPHKVDDMAQLAKEKSFDFYEFGKARIAHSQFSAKSAICRDYKAKSGVNVKIATTYYLDSGGENYLATLVGAQASRKNGEIRKFTYSPSFNIDNKKLQEQIQQEVSSHGEKVAKSNVIEKLSVLENIVCR
ncbi:hypothetical protein [Basfia succiniciproducens]|uniref:hypothetical protein n=1 Tax=Basfia succiniciproducens TaxID=653940 RepID=UPI0008CD5D33|nr:hypothetical protein [Basfia succiniciproducens]SEQ61097.1 hypothetical protein SAMN02910415_01748 [Basfia succiniciproducens]